MKIVMEAGRILINIVLSLSFKTKTLIEQVINYALQDADVLNIVMATVMLLQIIVVILRQVKFRFQLNFTAVHSFFYRKRWNDELSTSIDASEWSIPV